jgi:hypothetical protein
MTTFLPPLSEDRGFGALVASFDPFSYLDRRTALASTTHLFGSVGTGLVTVQLGAGSDRSERARLKHGGFSQKPFPPNDSVTDGGYALGVADIELHPNVTGEYVQPGVGLRAHYEVGSGQLDWQRAELGVAGRLYVGPISLVARADAGATAASQLPLQRRFRLGGEGTLPGYAVDQFQGDYALLFRSFASYRLSVWKRPIHVWRSVFVPGVAPGFAVSAQGGWTAFSPAHRTAVTTSLETHGMRATAGGGLTLFSDAIHLGVARPLDGGAHWRFVGGVSATF